MKILKAILLTILIILIILFLPLSIDNKKGIFFWIALISAIWGYHDAKKKQINKYKTFFATNPGYVAVGMFFLWIIYFPWYLHFREKISNNLIAATEESKIDKSSGSKMVLRIAIVIVVMIIILSVMALFKAI